ncbi:MAG: hypothetical protein U5R31_03100 [Acidimicrobiia bacterium]|nr:hypothetical protein [Acidimicrobiia bacterium]
MSDGRRVRGKRAALDAEAQIPKGLVGRVEVLVGELRSRGRWRVPVRRWPSSVSSWRLG